MLSTIALLCSAACATGFQLQLVHHRTSGAITPKAVPSSTLIKKCTSCTGYMTYSVDNWPRAVMIMKELIETSASEKGCLSYSWTKEGSKLKSAETFVDGKAMSDHLMDTFELQARMFTGAGAPASLDSFEVYGPMSQTEKVKKVCVFADFHDTKAEDEHLQAAWSKLSDAAHSCPTNFMFEVQRLFNVFDEDNDSEISTTELQKGLRTMGVDLTNQQAISLRDYLDIDHDGRISITEFLASLKYNTNFSHLSREEDAWSAMLEQVQKERLSMFSRGEPHHPMTLLISHLFHSFDKDENNSLEIDELSEGLIKLGVYLSLTDLLSVYKNLDMDQNGVVTLKDIATALEHHEHVTKTPPKIVDESPRLRHFFEVDSGFFSKMSAEGSPKAAVTVHSLLHVGNWQKLKPILQELIQRTNKEPGCLYYGWDRNGSSLSLQGHYKNGLSVCDHYGNIAHQTNSILSSCKLIRQEIHGLEAELDIIKPVAQGLDPIFVVSESIIPSGGGLFGTSETLHRPSAQFYEIASEINRELQGPVSSTKFIDFDEGFVSKTAGVGDPVHSNFFTRLVFGKKNENEDKLCIVEPVFTISDWPAAKPLIQELIAASSNDPGCVYFGWTRVGDRLSCREAFKSGESVTEYLAKSASIFNKMISGPAKMEPLQVKGPLTEMKKLLPATYEFNIKMAKQQESPSQNLVVESGL